MSLMVIELHAFLTTFEVWSFECPRCKNTKELTARAGPQKPIPMNVEDVRDAESRL
jgi:hypothetical protein